MDSCSSWVVNISGLITKKSFQILFFGKFFHILNFFNNINYILNFIILKFFSFDIRLRHWKELRPMIQSRTHFSASVLNDEIFVFGGRNEKGILATSEKFSIVENKWSQNEKLRVPRCCHAQITIENKIYISGGYIQGMFCSFTLEINALYVV